MNNIEKLTAKDLITTAIFSVIFALMFGGLSFVGMIPVVYPFTAGIILIPCGIVWMYLRVKVPKKGSILVQSVVMALIQLLFGSFWPAIVCVIAGGAVAELVTMSRGYKSFKMDLLGYMSYSVFVAVAANLPPIVARDYYYTYYTAVGMDPAYMEKMMAFLTGPVFVAGLVVAVIGAALGALLGRKMMKKHLRRIDMEDKLF
jgi:energy-coupling factor transport system substrate-specific component